MKELDLSKAFTPIPKDCLEALTRAARSVKEEEQPMKKKISFALVLAIVLILASVTALAVTLSNKYFEGVAVIEAKSGAYEDWSYEEKKALLSLMKEYGVAMDGEKADRLLKGEGGETALDAFMAEQYGIDGRIDVITLAGILEKELGWIDDWTHEQRAWYTQVLIDNGMMGGDDDIFRMPGKDAVTPEQAIAAAKAEILKVWTLDESDLKDYQVKWDYLTHASDKEEKLLHYDIRFIPAARDNGEFTYYCSVAKDGHILTKDENRLTESPAEQKASREKAAHSLDPEADELLEKYETDHGMDRRGLRYWPLEHQKAMTDLIRPVILKSMEADPLYSNELYLYYASHFYGVPDEQAIPLEQAVERSKRALIDQLKVSEDWMARAVCDRRVYDVTDESTPMWKITISGSEELKDEMIETYGKTFSWFVRLNAYTGEIVRAQAIDVTVMSYEELIEIWN